MAPIHVPSNKNFNENVPFYEREWRRDPYGRCDYMSDMNTYLEDISRRINKGDIIRGSTLLLTK